MLSAITKCVRTIGAQRIEGRNHLIHLAVSAFPDVRPWLVRKGCLGDDSDGSSVPNEDLEELYYVYLSLLLHPSHGHEAARQDMDLVKEWCSLSVASGVTDDAYRRSRKGNFMVVASRKQPEYKSYRRDVPFLLDLAVEVNEIELALELSKYRRKFNVLIFLRFLTSLPSRRNALLQKLCDKRRVDVNDSFAFTLDCKGITYGDTDEWLSLTAGI